MHILFIVLAFLSFHLSGFDTPQFYKARHFPGEPRFEKAGLISFDTSLTGGKTSHAYNQCGKKICLLDDLPYKLQSRLGIIPDWQHQRLQGEFSFFEWSSNIYINIKKGFFLQSYLPFRHLSLDAYSPGYHPMASPLQNHILPNEIHHSGLADLSMLSGWSINYQDTEFLDFIDFEVKTGVIWPTSKSAHPALFFDIPLGYNGHFGFPFSSTFATGVFEWLSAGMYGQAIVFSDRTQNHITKKRSPLLSAACYAKADHVIGGLSLLIGYSYDNQLKRNTETVIIDAYKHWTMHTLQTILEYDFNTDSCPIGGRLLLKYEAILGGKNIFHTALFGGIIGLDYSYNF